MKDLSSSGRILVGMMALIVILAFGAHSIARASSFKVIYGFCSVSGCADGESPTGNLVEDSAGNLYGVADGGAYDGGVVYELSPNGNSWTEHVLYNFCNDGSCAGGALPGGGLIRDSAGNLYGTTSFVNGKEGGTAFELSPNAQQGTWTLTVLHEFCQRANCADGEAPSVLSYQGEAVGMSYDGASPLYGTTLYGGKNASGTVFELTPPANRSTQWTHAILHDFCARACTDGGFPSAGVIVDSAGNLYGTTSGALFELKLGKSRWKATTLHSFCLGDDGCNPMGSLFMDGSGNLYGVTENGGNHDDTGQTAGIVYELTLGGSPQYSILYKFCSKGECTDGEQPIGGVTMTTSGKLFGTTAGGGGGNGFNGVLFGLPRREKVLHSFCLTDCKDGSEPEGGLLTSPNNHLFGTTWQGGPHYGGEVFEYVP